MCVFACICIKDLWKDAQGTKVGAEKLGLLEVRDERKTDL